MQSAALLEKEVSELRAANEKQKQKRTRSRRQIPAEEGLSVQEASQLITELVEVVKAPPSPPRRSLSPALQPQPPLTPAERVIVKAYGGWTSFMQSFGLKPWKDEDTE
ncbi:hypothetical protein N7447_009609 [Penicillium robsamsonii]|uniref:uncharacterized protein n=1 Tax=Penicillium robsamsonii TaxID=1792511 RepID=UPI002548271B|nr:uncharacterized protein N7447_009609 [Penicillium robsamsonii]KAJ5817376.1 hypothetical protein N7447_009609 [Penicillium robsamsonii]